MEHQVLTPAQPGYPARAASRLGSLAPTLFFQGPLRLLERYTLAVMASDTIPARAVLATHQLLFVLREFGLNYVGGWHSVMETEILRLALDHRTDPRGIRSLTLFTARGLDCESWESFLADRFGDTGPFTGFPEKEEYFRRAHAGEILVLSAAAPEVRRMTRANVVLRNLAACALADAVFVPFAEKGTKTYALCKRLLALGVPVFATDCADNKDLAELGVPLRTRKDVGAHLEALGARTQAEPAFSATQAASSITVLASPPAPPVGPREAQLSLFRSRKTRRRGPD